MSLTSSQLISAISAWVGCRSASALGRLLQARDLVEGSKGWRRCGIALGAGALSDLALAPFSFWPVLFFTLPVLIWLIDGPRDETSSASTAPIRAYDFHATRRAAFDGWWFGFGYFFFGLFWIGEAFLVEAHIFGWLLPFAVTLMPAGLALFFAAAAFGARLIWTNDFGRILALSVTLGCAEWLRGHIFTGFPWNVLGYALTYPLSFMQAAGVIGIYGLTLWVIVVFAAPLVVLAGKHEKRGGAILRVIVATVVPLAVLFGYGNWRLDEPAPELVSGVMLRIVQPSIPQKDKWAGPKQSEVFEQHIALSRRNAAGRVDDLSGVSHVIWPEAAMPFGPLSTPAALTAIGELLPPGRFLLAGALRRQNTDADGNAFARPHIYNSLMAFDDQGGLAALYDKTHLVPFGEYLPFQNALEAIGLQQLTRVRGGFSVGVVPRPLMSVSHLPPIGPLICYEAIFPTAVVQGRERPGVLINVTNDGWFGNMTGPYQHFHQSRVRAVEEGLPLVRAANNGISATIGPYGRIVGRLGLNDKGVIDTGLPKAIARPVYARFGDAIFLVNAFVFLLIVFGFWANRLRAI